MSNEQIPTAAQLGAARAQLWHQAVPESSVVPSVEAAEEPVADETAADDSAGSHEVEIADGAAVNEDQQTDEAGSEEQATPEVAEAAPEAQAPIENPAILTAEAAREFLESCGLLQFQPMGQMASAPAPTLVEATLGRRTESSSVAEMETARALLARLVAEGAAVPLNLLGAPSTTGEAPDYVASTAAFAYVFTLRGDKAWKQLPSTSGASKVSPLAVNTYALLVEQGPQSAYALTGELGKGLTEAAVLRALSELWQQLRVIPVAQAGGKPTIWEPVTTRLMKQIKAGANAGQPTSLSALISLYLRQALLATEEEIATFLSPLAARSRVREVLHALVASQQMEEMVIEGRHHLHIAGELPQFAAPVQEPKAVERKERSPKPEFTGEGRIKRFGSGGRPSVTDRGVRSRPFAGKTGDAGPRRFSERRDRPAESGGRPAFARPRRDQGDGRPAERRFDRPWQDDARPKRPREDRAAGEPAGQGRGGFRSEGRDGAPRRPWKSDGRPAFDRKPGFGAGKPRFGGDRPAFQRDRDRAPEGGAGQEGRTFAPKSDRPERRERGAWAPPRQNGGRPSFGGDRPAFGAGRQGRDDGERRPATRKPFGGNGDFKARPARPRRDDGDGGAPPRREGGGFRPKTDRPTDGGKRPPFRRFDERPAPRPFAGKRPDRSEGFSARPSREGSGAGDRRDGAAGRPARKPFNPGGGERFARPAGKSEGGKRGGPFDKFMGPAKGGVKPWGKRPPARKPRPDAEGGA